MKNKIILITGTNAGIGKNIVKLLEKEKCIIIATSRKQNKKNKKNIFYYNLDVTNESQWRELIHNIKTKFGRLDVLVNNAGIRESGDYGSPIVLEDAHPAAEAYRKMAKNFAQQIAIVNAQKSKLQEA